MTITWTQPSFPSGIITRYEVYSYSKESNYLWATLAASTAGDMRRTVLSNLSPYTVYQFSLKACNNYACTKHSTKISATTQLATPIGQSAPTATVFNSSTIELDWSPPSRPNGPLPLHYKVSIVEPLYNSPPIEVVRGVHFSGFGYYRFSGEMLPDSATTLITLSFKTKFEEGLMLYASSTGQEDLIVIEMRNGKPWFVFDTESGPAAFTVQSAKTFNDEKWHKIEVTRDMREGKIIIDGVYEGSGSSTGTKNVIGQISTIYVGGLPKTFLITRKDSGVATIRRFSFIGCIVDINFKNTPLDFKNALSKENVPPLSDHCPLFPEDGIYFKGHGYLVLDRGVFNGGPNFLISFKLKTSLKDGLIICAEGVDTHFIVFIKDKTLYLRYKQPTQTEVQYKLSSSDLCDNKLHEIVIENKARQLSAKINGAVKTIASLTSDMTVSSETYIGGIPATVTSVLLKKYQITTTLGGCLSDLKIGSKVQFQHVIKDYRNVDFNGCPGNNVDMTSCHNPTPVTIYDGQEQKVISSKLKPFTEYLYRVSSYHRNVNGYAHSPWLVMRSGEGGKSNISIYCFSL